MRLAAALVWAGLAAAPAFAVEEPAGYRMEDYRAPTPATLRGAVVLDDAGVQAMWEAGEAVFVDVMPRPPRPPDLPAGTVWRDRPRESIPGAVWLPNVGYGRLPEPADRYFREGLARISGGDLDRPLVIFCEAECWMSWNAARRALKDYGYRRVHWYPGGTDGWAAAGRPLRTVEPEP